MQLRKVYPLERFSVKNIGVISASLRLDKSKFYTCPNCNTKTLIRHNEVSPFAKKKLTTEFDKKTLKLFDDMEKIISFPIGSDRIMEEYDFFCRRCRRPVRLLYDEQERGMGGVISAVIYQIIEQI